MSLGSCIRALGLDQCVQQLMTVNLTSQARNLDHSQVRPLSMMLATSSLSTLCSLPRTSSARHTTANALSCPVHKHTHTSCARLVRHRTDGCYNTLCLSTLLVCSAAPRSTDLALCSRTLCDTLPLRHPVSRLPLSTCVSPVFCIRVVTCAVSFAPQRLDRTRSAITHRTTADRSKDGGDDFRRPLPAVPTLAAHLYSIPPHSDPVWRDVVRALPNELQRVRILRSRSTRGEIATFLDHVGVLRAIDWSLLPDLLYLDPLRYLQSHPQYVEVWIELDDISLYSASHGTGSAGEVVSAAGSSSTVSSSNGTETTANLALVLRRSEFTHEFALLLRQLQFDAFHAWNVELPPSASFLDTLHGR